MTDEPERTVVPFRPRPSDLEATIREIPTEDRFVYLGPHARDRMVERSITRPDALRVLRVGSIDGPIEQGRVLGEWKCKVVARVKGESRDRCCNCGCRREEAFP